MPRLFTAIELDAPVRDGLARAQAILREAVDRDGRDLRLMPSSQFHVTLVFLGEVAVPRAHDIQVALRAPFPCEPFTIDMGDAGTFPGRGAPRVLWLGLAGGVPHLVRLAAQVQERLVAAGAALDARDYCPHITLGRWREGRSPRRLPLLPATPPVPSQVVRTVTLFESRLQPRGAEHIVLMRTPLAGA